MDIADPRRSQVVLIGTSSYAMLEGLPAVRANLTDLHATLTDRDVWGLPPENIRVIADESDPAGVFDQLCAAAKATGPDGLLLIYYAGHGLIDDHDLVLGLPRTDPQFPSSRGLGYHRIRSATRLSRTSSRIVVLDCCYAGRAGREFLSAGDAARLIVDRAETEDAFLLLAVGPNAAARSPLDRRHTAFTGALLTILKQGTSTSNHVLTIKAVADEVKRHLRDSGEQLPQIRTTNDAADIPLVRNVRVRGHDLTGTVLRADPGNTDADLRDSRFLVLRHNESGAMGVRLGRPDGPLPAPLYGWLPVIHPPHQLLFEGGPLAQDTYIALVRLRPRADSIRFTPITDRLGSLPLTDPLSSNPTVVAEMRIFKGYLGWGPGHLEQLIKDEAMWIDATVPAARAVFSTGPWS
jgi:putative transcriptional regulator